MEKNFEQEGRPRWKPLKSSTVKQRTREGKWPGKILQRSGSLAASITPEYTDNSAAVSTNKKYAAIHQFGGKAGRGHKAKIPPRPYLKLTEQDIIEIKNKIASFINRH